MSQHGQPTTVPAGTRQSQGFGTLTAERSAELAAIAVAASAKAEVESAYVMAMRNPRHAENARASIVQTCRNPLFAGKARYRKQVGKKEARPGVWEPNFVVGPSIRFAEEALRHWGNVLVQQTTIYDDESKRIVKVSVKDLEQNIGYSQEIALEKQVERRDNRDRDVLGQRTNSYGKTVYIVRATEDELSIKQAAHVSKAIRTCGLRLIPDYVLQEAMDTVTETQASKIQSDPQAARRKLVDEFAGAGVKASDLEAYLQHPLAQATTEELMELQEALTSIRDGQASWSEFAASAKEDETKQATADAAKLEDVKAKMRGAPPKTVDRPTAVATTPPPTQPTANLDTDEPAPPISPPDHAHDATEVDDETWAAFLEAVNQNPQLVNVGKGVKKKMGFEKISNISLSDRRKFILSVQDAARKWKVPMPMFVDEGAR